MAIDITGLQPILPVGDEDDDEGLDIQAPQLDTAPVQVDPFEPRLVPSGPVETPPATITGLLGPQQDLERVEELIDVGDKAVVSSGEVNMPVGDSDEFNKDDFDRVVFSEKIPELASVFGDGISDISQWQSVRLAVGLLTSVTPEQQISLVKTVLPEAKIAVDDNGTVKVNHKGKDFVVNKRGASPQDLLTGTFQLASSVGAARLAALGKTIFQKIGIAGASEAATSVGLDLASDVSSAESLSDIGRSVSAERAAIAGLTGKVGEALGPVMDVVGKRFGNLYQKQIKNIPDGLILSTDDLMKATRLQEQTFKETGVMLTLPQALENRTLQMTEEVLGSIPTTSKIVMDELGEQNENVRLGLNKLMEIIAPARMLRAEGPDAAKFQLRDKAFSYLEALSKARKKQAAEAFPKVFSQAKKEGFQTDLKPVFDKFQELQNKTSGEVSDIFKALEKAKLLVAGATDPSRPIAENVERIVDGLTLLPKNVKKLKPGTDPAKRRTAFFETDLEKLDTAAEEISDAINKLMGGSERQRKAGAFLSQANDVLKEEMKKFTPYRAAKLADKKARIPIEEMKEGLISDIAKLQDKNIDKIRRMVFNTDETNFLKLKKLIQQDMKSPEAWNELVVSEIKERMLNISNLDPEGLVLNVPGKISQQFFDKGSTRNLFLNALDGEVRENWKVFGQMLERARLGRPKGPETAEKTDLMGTLRTAFGSKAKKAIFSPLETAQELGGELEFEKKIVDLARLFVDPKLRVRIKKINRLSNNQTAYFKGLATEVRKYQLERDRREEKRAKDFKRKSSLGVKPSPPVGIPSGSF